MAQPVTNEDCQLWLSAMSEEKKPETSEERSAWLSRVLAETPPTIKQQAAFVKAELQLKDPVITWERVREPGYDWGRKWKIRLKERPPSDTKGGGYA